MFYLFLNTAFLDIIFVSIHNGFCYLLLQKCLETQPTANKKQSANHLLSLLVHTIIRRKYQTKICLKY